MAEPAVDVEVGQRIRDLRAKPQACRSRRSPRAPICRSAFSARSSAASPRLRCACSRRIADVLGVGIAALFGAESETAAPVRMRSIIREDQRAELKLWRTGISKQLLSPAGSEGRLNLFLVHMEPGGNTGDELYTHDGEEAGLVLEGEMNAHGRCRKLDAQAGDSFRFASRRPHRFSNPSARRRRSCCG